MKRYNYIYLTCLKEIPADMFFFNCGMLYEQEFISNKFKKAIIQSGLAKKLDFHNLCYSFASNFVSKDILLYVVKELIGHESINTSLICTYLQNQSLVNTISVF